MTTPSQAAVRAWARSRGLAVNDRGSLSAAVTDAYTAAHRPTPEGTTVTSPARKSTARKSTARKSTARKSTPRKSTPTKASKAAPKATPRARRAPAASTARAVRPSPSSRAAAGAAPAAGTVDLAGGLRAFLDEVGTEVHAVSALSVRIDALVEELNGAREEQATRLLVLDRLRASADDQTLGAFLDKAIRPRTTRVPEVIPERLTQP
jgi:hypothetical protein